MDVQDDRIGELPGSERDATQMVAGGQQQTSGIE